MGGSTKHQSNPNTTHPDHLMIRSNAKTLWINHEGRWLIAVFTDGSAYCTASEWLAHGGWGVHTPGADYNTAGHLAGAPITSYRAEARAMLDAVTRAAEPICVICDNKAAVKNLQAIFDTQGAKQTWHNNDECADFWRLIAAHIHARPHVAHLAKWMPSHLDNPERAHIRKQFLEEGAPKSGSLATIVQTSLLSKAPNRKLPRSTLSNESD